MLITKSKQDYGKNIKMEDLIKLQVLTLPIATMGQESLNNLKKRKIKLNLLKYF